MDREKCLLLQNHPKPECACSNPFECPFFEEFKQLALEKWPPKEAEHEADT